MNKFSAKKFSAAFLFFVVVACGNAAPAQSLAHTDSNWVSVRGRALVELLTTQHYDAMMPQFDSTMASLLSPEKLQKMWDGIVEKTGAFKSITGIKRDSAPPYQVALVTCAFQKNFFDVKVVFNSARQVAGLFVVPVSPRAPVEKYSSPAYVNAGAFIEKLITIGHGPWMLHGTLTVPKTGGPFPAVVLVHGSGPNDRDETIGPNKPFRDIAQGLASRGVAVLRYEKRTHEHAPELFSIKDSITVKEETVDDAILAVEMLRKRDEINPKKIFVLGHSLGGMLAPRIAEGDTAIAGLIIMAGTTRPLEDVIVEQYEYLIGKDTLASDSARTRLQMIRTQAAQVKSTTLTANTPASFLPLGVPALYWLDLRAYNPALVVEKIHRPILVLQGGRDYQVSIIDFNGWQRALATHHDATFKTYPDLNHLFISGKGKSSPEEYNKAGHVELQVIEDIAKWLTKL